MKGKGEGQGQKQRRRYPLLVFTLAAGIIVLAAGLVAIALSHLLDIDAAKAPAAVLVALGSVAFAFSLIASESDEERKDKQ